MRRGHRATFRTRLAYGVALALAAVLAGCVGQGDPTDGYVPAHCHGATAPFATFAIRQESVPGFIEPVLQTALEGALLRQGLARVANGGAADVTMVARFALIDLDPQGEPGAVEVDAFGDRVVPGRITRFIAHVDLELVDNRDGALVWRGAVDRHHAILGGETFHDERAILIISDTLDRMLDGITRPCGG